MQITAEKLTWCDDREVKFELIILFRPGTIEFPSSAVDVWALIATEDFVVISALRALQYHVSAGYLN